MSFWDQVKSWTEKTDWNPAHSALGTGAGTPWSAGNKNTWQDYANILGGQNIKDQAAAGAPGFAFGSPELALGGATAAAPYFSVQQLGNMDTGGQQREEDTQRKNKEAEAAMETTAKQAKETADKTAAEEALKSSKEGVTSSKTSLEKAYDAFNPAKTRRIYGGY